MTPRRSARAVRASAAGLALGLAGAGGAMAQDAGAPAPVRIAQAAPSPAQIAQAAPSPARSRATQSAAQKPPVSRPAPAPASQRELTTAATSNVAQSAAWQRCTTLSGTRERLDCFDRWAQDQQALVDAVQARSSAGAAASAAAPASASAPVPAPAPATAAVAAALASTQPPAPEGSPTVTASTGILGIGLEQGCKDRQFSDLSRFWELEEGSSCPTFSLRGFRPNSLSAVAASSVNDRPTSANPANSATTALDYSKQELRLQLSVRTKIASGLLTPAGSSKRDSLWFAYSQQSYWQFFNSGLSRPFRSTDYEPEAIYVYPTDLQLPGGVRWRYAGAGLVHQSNGQSDPLSRSWNRYYLMTGFELGNSVILNARAWKRINETVAKDNNPDIVDYIGRGELQAIWNVNRQNTLSTTLRSSFGRTDRGSGRIEWMRSLGDGAGNTFSGLRLHTQLFSGYGDSLIDYNRKRTVFSIGLSLVDF